MAKVKSIYVCSECGFESPKWYGKCPSCGEWNTLNEELPKTEFKGNFSASLGAVEQIMSSQAKMTNALQQELTNLTEYSEAE